MAQALRFYRWLALHCIGFDVRLLPSCCYLSQLTRSAATPTNGHDFAEYSITLIVSFLYRLCFWRFTTMANKNVHSSLAPVV
jgi:hypothetical protein